MSDVIATSLIAGFVSLIVSSIGFLASLLTVRNQRRSLERQIKDQYSSRLYEERLRLYPKAYAALSRIRRVKAPRYLPSHGVLQEIRGELNVWAEDSSLYFSRNTAKAYWELRRALSKNPGRGDNYEKSRLKKFGSFVTNLGSL